MICQNSLFVVVLLTISFSDRIDCNHNELDVDFEKLKEKLPPGIEFPSSVQNMTLPKLEEVTKVIREKCAKVSGSETAYEAIEAAVTELQTCTTGLIDVEQLQNEIKEATPNGELDTVFNKYCGKREIAIGCVKNFTAAMDPCLEKKEIEGKQILVQIIEKLLNFVCYKEGDHIALFIAEKGPECFNEQKDNLITCINSTFYGYLPSEKDIEAKIVPSELPELVMGTKQCNEMDTLKNCVVKSLEACEESTPANLVESMFRFVRKETPCGN